MITKLKRQINALLERNMAPIHTADLFWELRPYMAIHRIELTDHGIILPPLSSKDTSVSIDSDQVACISVCRNGVLMLFLFNGKICMLSRHSSTRKQISVYQQEFFHLILMEIQLRFWALRELLLYWCALSSRNKKGMSNRHSLSDTHLPLIISHHISAFHIHLIFQGIWGIF